MPVQGGMLYTGGIRSSASSPGSIPVTHARSSNAYGARGGYDGRDYLLMVLRVLTISFTLASLMLMLHAKQTVTVFLGKLKVTKTADYKDVRVFSALVWTEGTVTGVTLLLFVIHLAAKDLVWTSPLLHSFVYFLNQGSTYAMVAMASATTEVAWIAKRGEAVPQWRPTCPKYGKFCHQVGVSLGLAFAAALLLILISFLTAFRPRYHHRMAVPPAASAAVDSQNLKSVVIQQAGPQQA